MPKKDLLDTLKSGEAVLVGEGYLFEFERRGYLKAGGFVPEVVLRHPDLVKGVSEEFVHAGSDVVLAFTYYGTRSKMRVAGIEDELEAQNRKALQIARQVADETNTFMAGNLCNTTTFNINSQEAVEATKAMFKEQAEWAVEEKADYILAETFGEFKEAEICLEMLHKYAPDLPKVVSIAPCFKETLDGIPYDVACKKLEDQGADVVGLNCVKGPGSMLPLMKKVRAACKGPLSAVPVTYRTSEEHQNFLILPDENGHRCFPGDLDMWRCTRTQMGNFAKECYDMDVKMIGMCCGGGSHYMRSMAEAIGRTVPASRYSANMEQHFVLGNLEETKVYRENDIKNSWKVEEIKWQTPYNK